MMNRFQIVCIMYACFGATFYGYDTSVLLTANLMAMFRLTDLTKASQPLCLRMRVSLSSLT